MTVWDDDAEHPFETGASPRAETVGAGGDVAALALVVVGALGVLAWAWVAYRAQARGSQFPGFDDLTGTGFGERVDLFASSLLQLVFPVAAIAGGRHLQRKV